MGRGGGGAERREKFRSHGRGENGIGRQLQVGKEVQEASWERDGPLGGGGHL